MLQTRYQILNSQYLKGIQITQYLSFNKRFCCCLFLEFVLLKLHCLVFCCLAALFALFVVSPRLYLILCITLSWTCVKGSGSDNKDCINQTGVRLSAAYNIILVGKGNVSVLNTFLKGVCPGPEQCICWYWCNPSWSHGSSTVFCLCVKWHQRPRIGTNYTSVRGETN